MKNFYKYLQIIQEKTTFVPGSGGIPEKGITTIKELNDYVNEIDGSAIQDSDVDENQYLISLGTTDDILILIEYPYTTKKLIEEVLYHKSLNFLLKYFVMGGIDFLNDYVQRMNGSKIMRNVRHIKDENEYQIYIPKGHGKNKAQLFSIKYPKDLGTLYAEIMESQSLNFLLNYRINRELIEELNIYADYINEGSGIEKTDPGRPNLYIVCASELEGTDDDLFTAKYDKGINELIDEITKKRSLMFLLKYKINHENNSSREETKFDKIKLNMTQKNKASESLKGLLSFSGFDSNFVDKVYIDIDENPMEIYIITDFGEGGIDHDGGEDGEEWMDEQELEENKKMYFNRFRALYSLEFKKLKEKFKATENYSKFKSDDNFSSYVFLDYEESGAISIILKIKPKSLQNIIKIDV